MMEKAPESGAGKPSAGRTLWLYGYEMILPHHAQIMTAIRGILDRENDEAKRGDRTWSARLVTEQQATHVLIVSASPDQDREITRKLEAELKAMGVDYLSMLPMPVRDDHEPTQPASSDEPTAPDRSTDP